MAADQMKTVLARNLRDKIGPVINLGSMVDIEILDIDMATDRSEV